MSARRGEPSIAPVSQALVIGWSHADLARVADVATAVAGLVFSVSRQPSAETAMRRVMSAYRLLEPVDLYNAVKVAGEVQDALLAELTVGESYFFRDEGQLSLLGGEILPGWRAESSDAPRRIWSAGCASGEEPYTLAILLRELGWGSPVSLLGTDIALPRLDAARRGRYTKWALRGMDETRLTRWFRRRGPHFLLDNDILRAADFRQLNLASDAYPSIASATSDQDLILCRNVLIYFDLDTVVSIAERLLRALRPTGWLVLGASDPPLVDLVECEVVMTASGIAYRPRASSRGSSQRSRWLSATAARPARPPEDMSDSSMPEWAGRPAAVPLAPARMSVSSSQVAPDVVAHESAEDAYARGDYATAERLAQDAVLRDPENVTAWIVRVRSAANSGQLTEAGEICAVAIDRHRLVPELHYLHGILQIEAGRSADGARDARRALYLDRTLIMGHMLLGAALTNLDDREGARRAFQNATDLLAGHADTGLITGSDGVPVARLRQMAQHRLRALTAEDI
ncbi:MAG: CheR family methyltransferase [Gemmatimonadaceae bacterium]